MHKSFFSRMMLGGFLLAAVFAAGVPAAAYSDVKEGGWAHEAISAMSEAGVIEGFPDGSFKPSERVTHGEFIKMAYLAAGGGKAEEGGNGETGGGGSRGDAGGHWALPYYEAAADAGLFARHEIPKTRLSAPIPRAYMALILSKAMGDASVVDYDAVREKIKDVEWDTPHEYDIVKATAQGLITGYPDGTFRPEGTLTRAEAATVMYRLTRADKREFPDLRPESEKTPLERLEGIGADKMRPLSSVVAAGSNSKRPISEIIDDPITYFVDDAPVLYYEMFDDYPHQMRIGHDLVGREVVVIGYDFAYGFLIKDRKTIAEIDAGMPALGYAACITGMENGYIYNRDTYDGKFPDFDYIAIPSFYEIDGNTRREDGGVLLLIPNNMK
ncbi:MAG: S-layer homology domain-containing protein [Clostridiales Family XIII bacterium]|jgi:hypothetical protein|nr:S-layer homology domain-containing protein [Clostridiales Family XIII bacterium]